MKDSQNNNPTLKEISEIADIVEGFSLFEGLLPNDQVNEMKNDIKIIRAAENFNDIFKTRCWILNDYFSASTVEKAINLATQVDLDTAEDLLVNSVIEYLDLFMIQIQSAPEFNARKEILECAKKLYINEEYLAVIPLLLTTMDGIVNDLANLGLFAQGVDLDAWDSLTQHNEGLSYIHSNFLTKSRTKTNKEAITLPYRNGILHGRDINFGNKTLAAKCWGILFVLRTWYRDKKDESFKLEKREEKKNLTKINIQIASYLDAFKEREYLCNKDNNDECVVVLCADFLNSWQNKQWGKIVPLMQHAIGKQRGKEASYIKNIYQEISLNSFELISVVHNEPSHAKVICNLNIEHLSENKKVEISFRYSNNKSDFLPEGHPDGSWYVMQNSLSHILFKKK